MKGILDYCGKSGNVAPRIEIRTELSWRQRTATLRIASKKVRNFATLFGDSQVFPKNF